MSVTKANADVLDLTDAYAFSGTVTGTNSGLVFIATTNLAAAGTDVSSMDFTGLTADYDTYMIRVSDMHPTADNTAFYMRMGDSGGLDTGGSDYSWGFEGDNFNDTSHDEQAACDNADAQIEISSSSFAGSAGNATGEGVCATIYMNTGRNNDMAPTVTFHLVSIGDGGLAGTGNAYTVGAGARLAEIDVDRVSFFFGSGNIVSGRISIYGLSNS
jgi:hypothetical protein